MVFCLVKQLFNCQQLLKETAQACRASVANSRARVSENSTKSTDYSALIDPLEQRLMYSAEHPLGLGFITDNEDNSFSQHANDRLLGDALDLLRSQQQEAVPSVQPLNDASGTDEFVIIDVTTAMDVVDAPNMTSYAALMNNVGIDNEVSFREAITVANADSSVDMVRLDTDTYHLSQDNEDMYEDLNQSGDIDIKPQPGSSYVIQGNGEASTIIEQGVVNQRVFEVLKGSITIAGITIQSGSATNSGGGLLALNASDITFNDVTFYDNEATDTAGAALIQGTALFENVTFTENRSDYGGALHVEANGIYTGINNTFTENTANFQGGGVRVDGDLFMYDSLFELNSAKNDVPSTDQLGGGAFITGSGVATFENTVFRENNSGSLGGGIHNSGQLTLSDVRLIENEANTKGGGLFNDGYANIERTLFWGNKAIEDADSAGGAIYNAIGGDIDLLFSVIANNFSGLAGAGIQSQGVMDIRSSSIIGNNSTSPIGAAGLHFSSSSFDDFLTLKDTLIAENRSDGNESDARSTPNNEITSLGFNLIQDPQRVALTDTDIVGDLAMISEWELIDNEISLEVSNDSAIWNSGSVDSAGETSIAHAIMDSTPNIGGITANIDKALIFWAGASGDLYRSSPNFSFNQRIATGLGTVADVQLHNGLQRVYWMEAEDDLIRSSNLDGSDVRDEQYLDDEAVAFTINEEENLFYIAVGDDDNEIEVVEIGVDKNSRAGALVIKSSGIPTDIEYDEEDKVLYWSNEDDIDSIESLHRRENDPQRWQNTSTIITSDGDFVDAPQDIVVREQSNVVVWTNVSDETVITYNPNEPAGSELSSFNTFFGFHTVAYNAIDNETIYGDQNDRYYIIGGGTFDVLDNNLPDTISSMNVLNIFGDGQELTFAAAQLDINTGVDILEGQTISIQDRLTHLDDDSRSDQIFYTHITPSDSNIDELTLTLDFEPVSTFTQEEADSGRVRITHSGIHANSDSNWPITMQFEVSDHNSDVISAIAFEVRVTNVNDVPEFFSVMPVSVIEGSSTLVGIEYFYATDEETLDANLIYQPASTAHGSFQIGGADITSFTHSQLQSGEVSFRHAGTEEPGEYNLSINVSDGDVTEAYAFQLEVDPVPVAPTVGEAATFTVFEGGRVALDNTVLLIDDADTPASSVQITVSGETEGHVELNNTMVSTFTLEQLNNELVEFVHRDVEKSFPPSVVLTVDDGLHTVVVPTIQFNVQPVNDNAPIAQNHTLSGKHGSTFDTVDTIDDSYSPTSSLLHGASDQDLPDDLLQVSIVAHPSRGTVVIDPNGEFNYTVDSSEPVDESFADFFTYQVIDQNDAVSNDARVDIDVIALEKPDYNGSLSDLSVNETDTLDIVLNINAFSSPENATPLEWSIVSVGADSTDWLTIDNTTRRLTGTPADENTGSYDLIVTVTDSNGLTSDEVPLRISVVDINQAPRIDSFDAIPLIENTTDAPVGTITASDPDSADTLEFSSQDSRFVFVGNELRISDPNTIDFESEESISFLVTVRDQGNSEAEIDITISVVNENENPVLQATNQQAVIENLQGAIVADVRVADPDAGDSVSIAVSDNRFEFSEGKLRLKPEESLNYEDGESVNVSVIASDVEGLEDSIDFTVQVLDVNEVPLLQTSIPDQQIYEDSVITPGLDAFIDPDGDQITYTLSLSTGEELPSWLDYDQSNNALRMADLPTNSVSAELVLTADDGRGGVSQVFFDVHFVPEPGLGAAEFLAEIAPVVEVVPINKPQVAIATNPATVEPEPEAESAPSTANNAQVDGTDELFDVPRLSLLVDGNGQDVSEKILRSNAITDFLTSRSTRDATNFAVVFSNDVFDSTIDLSTLFSAYDQQDASTFSLFSEAIKKQRDLFESELAASKAVAVSSITLGSGLSVGYILYLLRGGAIMTSMLTSLPAWRFVDPLPILGTLEDSFANDDESLQSIVAGTQDNSSDSTRSSPA